MPIVTINFVSHVDKNILGELDVALRTAIVNIRSLDLKPGDITCACPIDVFDGVRDEIIVEVTGLFSGEKRTATVRQILAEEIVATIAHFFHNMPEVNIRQVECFVYPFDPAKGFASYQRDENS